MVYCVSQYFHIQTFSQIGTRDLYIFAIDKLVIAQFFSIGANYETFHKPKVLIFGFRLLCEI